MPDFAKKFRESMDRTNFWSGVTKPEVDSLIKFHKDNKKPMNKLKEQIAEIISGNNLSELNIIQCMRFEYAYNKADQIINLISAEAEYQLGYDDALHDKFWKALKDMESGQKLTLKQEIENTLSALPNFHLDNVAYTDKIINLIKSRLDELTVLSDSELRKVYLDRLTEQHGVEAAIQIMSQMDSVSNAKGIASKQLQHTIKELKEILE